MADFTDPTGKKVFAAMGEVVARQGAGYVDYRWPKPGHSQPVRKVSYVAGFQPWGWIIGSGIYVDDVSRAAAAHSLEEQARELDSVMAFFRV